MSVSWEEDTVRLLCDDLRLDENHAHKRTIILDALGSVLEGYQTFVIEADGRPNVFQQMEELDTLRESVEATHACLSQLSELARLRIKNASVESQGVSGQQIPSHNYEQALQDAEHSLFLLTLAVPRAYDNLYWTTPRTAGAPRKPVNLLLRRIREVFDAHHNLPYQDDVLYQSACLSFVRHTLKAFPHIELPKRLSRALFSDHCQK